MNLKLPLALTFLLTSMTLGALSEPYFWPNKTTRTSIQRTTTLTPSAPMLTKHHTPGDCTGGEERIAQLDLVPDAVVTKGARRWIEYHSEIAIRRGDKAGVAWDSDIVDDRDRVVLSHLVGGKASAKAGDIVQTNTISTSGLGDGFYILRVRAAVSAPALPSDILEFRQYAQVKSGEWTEISDIDWDTYSQGRLAFSAAEPSTGVQR